MGACSSVGGLQLKSIDSSPLRATNEDPYEDSTALGYVGKRQGTHTFVTRWDRVSDDEESDHKSSRVQFRSEAPETVPMTLQPHSAVTDLCSRADPMTKERHGVSVGGMICVACGLSFTKNSNADRICGASDLTNRRHRAEAPPQSSRMKCIYCRGPYVPLAVCTKARFHHFALSYDTVKAADVMLNVDYPRLVRKQLYERACDLAVVLAEYFGNESQLLSATGGTEGTNRLLWRHAARAAAVVQHRQLFLPLPRLPDEVLQLPSPPSTHLPGTLLALPTRLQRIPVLPHVCVEERERHAVEHGKSASKFEVGPWTVERDDLRYIVSHTRSDGVVYMFLDDGDGPSGMQSTMLSSRAMRRVASLRVGKEKALRRAASLRVVLSSRKQRSSRNGRSPSRSKSPTAKGGVRSPSGESGAAASSRSPAASPPQGYSPLPLSTSHSPFNDSHDFARSAVRSMLAVESRCEDDDYDGRNSPWASAARLSKDAVLLAANTPRASGEGVDIESVSASDDETQVEVGGGGEGIRQRVLHEVVSLDLGGVSWWKSMSSADEMGYVCEWAVLKRSPVGQVAPPTSTLSSAPAVTFRAEMFPIPPAAVVPLWLTLEERYLMIVDDVVSLAWADVVQQTNS